MKVGDSVVLEARDFDRLLQALQAHAYVTLGPQLRDGAIVYGPLASSAELPCGITDEQEGGQYRLTARGDGALFGYALGPHSWKRYLHPPLATLWRARRSEAGFELEPPEPTVAPYAFIGVRACELQAIARLDRVLLGGAHADATYRRQRQDAFIVAVNCVEAGGTCFCASLGCGPRCASGFDLALSELLGDGHRFVLEIGTERGAALARELPTRDATPLELEALSAALSRAERGMGRSLDTTGLKELLYERYESPRWDELAKRCLACGNCTLVCPTCFCVAVEDHADLSGERAERSRRWDSCFSLGFSYIHGGSVRTSVGARYRQWITHKLGAWQDQFGSGGCVGCGRCITWCPVGIDITAEAAALRRGQSGGS